MLYQVTTVSSVWAKLFQRWSYHGFRGINLRKEWAGRLFLLCETPIQAGGCLVTCKIRYLCSSSTSLVLRFGETEFCLSLKRPMTRGSRTGIQVKEHKGYRNRLHRLNAERAGLVSTHWLLEWLLRLCNTNDYYLYIMIETESSTYHKMQCEGRSHAVVLIIAYPIFLQRNPFITAVI